MFICKAKRQRCFKSIDVSEFKAADTVPLLHKALMIRIVGELYSGSLNEKKK